jgi:hypothetical protein
MLIDRERETPGEVQRGFVTEDPRLATSLDAVEPRPLGGRCCCAGRHRRNARMPTSSSTPRRSSPQPTSHAGTQIETSEATLNERDRAWRQQV